MLFTWIGWAGGSSPVCGRTRTPTRCTRESSEKLTPLLLDVTDADSIRRARAAVEQAVGEAGLSGLVNNAGIAYGGPVEFLELDELRRAFEVNFFGAIAVTQAFLPRSAPGHGRIVNMSSNSGLVAAPFLTPYTTSKWALEALSDALRVELDPWKIRVVVIEPGAINTPIWTKGKRTVARIRERLPREAAGLYDETVRALEAGLRPHGIPPEHVARAVEHALTAAAPTNALCRRRGCRPHRLVARLPDGVRDAFFKMRLQRERVS